MNKHVENTKNQILNTLEILFGSGLARHTKHINCVTKSGMEILTWDNHTPGRHNAGKSFATLNQYVSIYETGAYHCILFDGSIIRACYVFDKNILVQKSLLYWPSPINIPEEDIDELGIRASIDMYLSDINSDNKAFSMRSPLRLDFDSTNISESHPATHLHLQHANCRMSVKKPICFNTFIKFIFMYFYPDIQSGTFDNLEVLNYSGFEVHQKAIINL